MSRNFLITSSRPSSVFACSKKSSSQAFKWSRMFVNSGSTFAWKIAPEFFAPCVQRVGCTTVVGVTKLRSSWLQFSRGSCQYPLTKSIEAKNRLLERSTNSESMCGIDQVTGTGDDIVLIGPEHKEVLKFKQELGRHLDVKYLGALRSFLEVLFTHNEKGVWLSQSHYILQILDRFGMSTCNSVTTPMTEAALREFVEIGGAETDLQAYQELLGCLLFISTRTRPDISAAVRIMCRFAASPTWVHWDGLKRILRYLRGTADYSLRIDADDVQVLKAYCDADWAGDRVDRKATSGVLMQLGRSTVAWRTLKQGTVALSTTEAEYCSMSEGAKLIVWLRKLLEELHCPQDSCTTMSGDNQGALVWSGDGIRHAKHVSIRMNFVKGCVDQSLIKLVYCPTQDMVADILTKPLKRVAFEKCRTAMKIVRFQELI